MLKKWISTTFIIFVIFLIAIPTVLAAEVQQEAGFDSVDANFETYKKHLVTTWRSILG